MVSYKIKDNRHTNFTAKIEVTNEDKVKVLFNEPWIEMIKVHCVQTDPAKNVWTRAYLIPERNRTVRRQEEGTNSVYLFVFCMNLAVDFCCFGSCLFVIFFGTKPGHHAVTSFTKPGTAILT